MSDKTGIEWCDATWNPIAGCSIVSPGCTNCYAMKMAARIEAMREGAWRKMLAAGAPTLDGGLYTGLTQPSKAGAVWTGKVALAGEPALTQPLRWKRPRSIFVNSMGDLFHESVPDEWIDRVFAVMALAPQHTFIVLTKRAKRMREYIAHSGVARRIHEIACDLALSLELNVVLIADGIDERLAPPGIRVRLGQWSLPNVILGVSCEDQTRAEERIPDLLATPAAMRIISAEPLLGAIDFMLRPVDGGDWDALRGLEYYSGASVYSDSALALKTIHPSLDAIILGGESGPGARPMHPDWARSIRDQCAAAGVPFFFKQWGEWALHRPVSGGDLGGDMSAGRVRIVHRVEDCPDETGTSRYMARVGKRRAGRLLDGRAHDDLPYGESWRANANAAIAKAEG